MALPSPAVLQASLRWLDLLRRGSLESAWATVRDGVHDGLTATQYSLAYDWMLRVGLVNRSGTVAPGQAFLALGDAQSVLAAALVHESPPWLVDAEDLIPAAQDLPIDWAEAAEALGESADDFFALVKALGGKIDFDARAALGAEGEELVVRFLRRHPGVVADRVSLISDAFGFDVVARRGDRRVHLEVKTVRPRRHARIYLSRNEFETMRRDRRWSLVLAIVGPDGTLVGLRTGSSPEILSGAPVDRAGGARWEVMRLRVRPDTWEPGVPQLAVGPPQTGAAEASIPLS